MLSMSGRTASEAWTLHGVSYMPAQYRLGRAAIFLGIFLHAVGCVAGGSDIHTLSQQADAGDAVARYQLGRAYETGQGAPQNAAKAIQLYRQAADAGYGPAMIDLGWFYQHGEHGLPHDPAQALSLYTQAADQGLAQGPHNLAVMYDQGGGIPEDNAQAAAWYTRAANTGHARAQLNLGVMLAQGEGIPRDLASAYKFLTLARLNTSDQQAQWAARGALDSLVMPQISNDQKRRIDDWFTAGRQFASCVARAEKAEKRKKWDRAADAYSDALELARRHELGPSETSAALYNLGRVTGFAGREEQAQRYLTEALDLERAASGPQSALTAMRLFELGRLHFDHSRFVEAERYFAQAIPIAERLGVEHDDPIGFASAIDDHAAALRAIGRHTDADRSEAKARALRDAHPGVQPRFQARRYR